MGQSLPVADQHVRRHLKVAERIEQTWDLAEGEQAGYVGEGGPAVYDGAIHLLQGARVEHDHRGGEVVPVVRDVQPGGVLRMLRSRSRAVDLSAERLLNGERFLGSAGPLHRCTVARRSVAAVR